MDDSLGRLLWAIPEGYIPKESTGKGRELESHETACILNTGSRDANIEMTIYFTDRDPAGPFQLTVPARRTRHVRFNDLEDPETIPKGSDFSCIIRSNVPVIVQHTRLDTRQAAAALMTTMAYPIDGR